MTMMLTKYKQTPMRKGEYEALEIILAYIRKEEFRDWERRGMPPMPPEGSEEKPHVYNFIEVLDTFRLRCQVPVGLEDKEDG